MYRNALPFLIALTLGLAACGSDGDETSAGTTPATDSTDGASGDQAQTPPDGSAPVLGGGGAIGSIKVTITHPDVDEVSYEIGCFGDTFPVTPEVEGVDGATACEILADQAVLDRLINGVPADQVCTEIYGGPDVAVIVGDINGESIDATIDRANGCGVDDWDGLLAGLLPPAVGATS